MTNVETQRVFFALWPQAGIAEALHQQAGVWQQHCRGRLMRRDTLHMTLFFVGDVSAAQLAALMKAADDIEGRACTMRVDVCGRWRHNRIVWAGVSRPPAALLQLADALNRSLNGLGFRSSHDTFKPHITLLRSSVDAPADDRMEPLEWQVRDFVLAAAQLRPEGARYRCLNRWPLQR